MNRIREYANYYENMTELRHIPDLVEPRKPRQIK